MLELPLVEETRRQLDICNACRYCEGVCAVFPALERRSYFNPGDMVYLANLCHDCRACFDVCPYAPPHELAVDIPKLMSQVREASYAHYAWPPALARKVDRSLPAALTFSTLAAAVVVLAAFVANGWDGMFTASSETGSFYEVIPWLAMMLPFMGISVAIIGVMAVAGLRFWRDTGAASGIKAESIWQALLDVALLRNLDGGGPGCTYPDERPNKRRRIWHSLLFYGFIAAFISTTLAAFYQDILGILPPYGYLSLPVIFGTVGGVAMIAGIVGLLWEKRRADNRRISEKMRTMDLSLIFALFIVNVTGLLVLVLRETAAMPILLAIHLGYTAALYVTLPYGKFAHALYRVAALIRNQLELAQERHAKRSAP